jgi:hypothetical protein
MVAEVLALMNVSACSGTDSGGNGLDKTSFMRACREGGAAIEQALRELDVSRTSSNFSIRAQHHVLRRGSNVLPLVVGQRSLAARHASTVAEQSVR